MPIPSFTSGEPPDGSTLGGTKVNIRNNLDGTFQTLSVDHQNQNDANPGYHTVIHMVNQGIDPPIVANISEIYTKLVGANQELFYRYGTGANLIFQLTNNGASSTANGFSSLIGQDTKPLYIQWGVATTPTTGSFGSGTATGTVTFPTAYNSACFSVVPGTRFNAAPSGSRYAGVTITSISATQFTWSLNGSSGASDGFYWISIGN